VFGGLQVKVLAVNNRPRIVLTRLLHATRQEPASEMSGVTPQPHQPAVNTCATVSRRHNALQGEVVKHRLFSATVHDEWFIILGHGGASAIISAMALREGLAYHLFYI
jgi:hypothetical protein